MRIEHYKGKRDGWNLAILLDPFYGFAVIIAYVSVKSIAGLIKLFRK